MTKSRPFSIYLLKAGYDDTTSLKTDHNLEVAPATNLPENATLYILDADPKTPWWKNYFGVEGDLRQQYKGRLCSCQSRAGASRCPLGRCSIT
jgi:uncharacterized protein (TIGR04141 family)